MENRVHKTEGERITEGLTRPRVVSEERAMGCKQCPRSD